MPKRLPPLVLELLEVVVSLVTLAVLSLTLYILFWGWSWH